MHILFAILTICFTLFMTISAAENTSVYGYFAFLLTVTVRLYLYCYYGDCLREKVCSIHVKSKLNFICLSQSFGAFFGIYESNWQNLNIYQKKQFILTIETAAYTKYIRAYGFFKYSRSLYADVRVHFDTDSSNFNINLSYRSFSNHIHTVPF